jgi:hypothetical protein
MHTPGSIRSTDATSATRSRSPRPRRPITDPPQSSDWLGDCAAQAERESVSLAELADSFGVSLQEADAWRTSGRLVCFKRDGRWFVDRETVERFSDYS